MNRFIVRMKVPVDDDEEMNRIETIVRLENLYHDKWRIFHLWS